MKITGLVWAIVSLLIGCAQSQKMVDPKTESQNQKIQQMTMELHKSQQAYLVLMKENQKLKADNLRLMKTSRMLKQYNLKLMNTNSLLETDNRELVTKINMLKTLDHRVEEKRKNYTSD
jgi:predicted RNase H-like nuclease (RuvC/YqgF family)